MNTDMLECKKKAMEFLKSENPLCHVNGRKKGYIQVMKDLWDKKGYEHLGLKSQNLRDQAARLEKINATAETRAVGEVSGGAVIDDEREQTLDENQRRHNTISQHEFNNFENQNTISQNLAQHINDWNNASQTQHIALTAEIFLLATALQKPSVKSKAKDHKECLEKRLALWKEGEVESSLREGRSIQKRLANAKRTEAPNKAKIFPKLVMEGQINSALRYLSEADFDGVLPLTDD
ncbi:Hypothetical predicted protein, partial [Paramuricea clavata]